VKLALTVQQIYAGMVSAAAVLGAYFGARVNGTGQHVDLSLYEIMVTHQDRGLMAHAAYQYTGAMPQRSGLGGRVQITPNSAYPCADGYVQMFALNQVWRNACIMIERPDLIDDPHFTAPENFEGNADVKAEFEALLLKWLAPLRKQEVMERAQAAGYICGAINTMEETFADRQLNERGFFVEVDHPHTGQLRYPGAPFRMTESPWRSGRAPLLGEHTDAILQERLGYSSDVVEGLHSSGVI
jgi:crotonobetainyl-CoA:carnitine CoA-transferase CaiB-like acyl-CoA transferase